MENYHSIYRIVYMKSYIYVIIITELCIHLYFMYYRNYIQFFEMVLM